MATGTHAIAEHFPGNQEESGGLAPAKELLQEAGEQIKRAVLWPCVPLPFFPRYKEKGVASLVFRQMERIWEVISFP
jgi:hypothetical protein